MDNQLLELGLLGTFVLASFKYLIDDKNKKELKQENREVALEERMREKEDERAKVYTKILTDIQISHKEDRIIFKDAIEVMEKQNTKVVDMLSTNNQKQTETLSNLNNSLVQITTQITSLNEKSNDLEKDLQEIKQTVAIKDKLEKMNK